MANQWFRLYSRIMTDPKIETISFEDQRHFVWLLCMKNEGYLDEKFKNVESFERMIARKLGLQSEAFENAKKRLLDANLIDENWQPVSWEKLQFVSDQDPTRSERQKRFREKQRNALCNATVTPLEQNRTEQNNSISNDIEPQKVAEKIPRKKTEPIPYQAIVDLYQEKLPMLNGVYKITEQRKAKIKTLWTTTELNSLETWGNYFIHVSRSKFLTGRDPPDRSGRTWKADLDFLINQTNFVKISEDKYHG